MRRSLCSPARPDFGLFLAPASVAPLWFWPLTPLLARMTAAWLLGVFSAAALVLVDNNLRRSGIVAATLIVYALLQAMVLTRYASEVAWSTPAAWLWVAVLVLLLLVNSWAWRASRGNRAHHKGTKDTKNR